MESTLHMNPADTLHLELDEYLRNCHKHAAGLMATLPALRQKHIEVAWTNNFYAAQRAKALA